MVHTNALQMLHLEIQFNRAIQQLKLAINTEKMNFNLIYSVNVIAANIQNIFPPATLLKKLKRAQEDLFRNKPGFSFPLNPDYININKFYKFSETDVNDTRDILIISFAK